MGAANFRLNQLVRIEGRIWRMLAKMPGEGWLLQEIEKNYTETRSETELLSKFVEGKLDFPSDRTGATPPDSYLAAMSMAVTPAPSSYDEVEIKNADHRAQYAIAIKGLSTGAHLQALVQATWERLQWPTKRAPHWVTVCGWAKDLRDAGGEYKVLLSRAHKRGNRKCRFSKDLMDFARPIVDDEYLTEERKSPAQVLQTLKDKILIENKTRARADWLPESPGRRIIDRILAEKTAFDIVSARYGADAAWERYRYSLGGKKLDRPLQVVELDHTCLDLFLIDDDGTPWGRPWLTMAIDSYSRCALGFYVGAEPPSCVSVARCIKHAVMPKTDFLKAHPEIKEPWECFGVWQKLLVDNGMELHAGALRFACSGLGGTQIEFCARKSGWLKGRVERYFRTQNQLFLENIEGKTFESIFKREDYDPEKHAVLTLADFKRVLAKWIVDVYNLTYNRGLKAAPIDVWRKAEREHRFEKFLATKTADLDRLFLRKEEGRCLDHEGVEFDCLQYNCPDLALLRDQKGDKLSVDILVSDEDVGFIEVLIPGTEAKVHVPCLDPEYANGLTRWQHERCKAAQRVTETYERKLSLAESREWIRQRIAGAGERLKGILRKRRARWNEGQPDASPASKGRRADTTRPVEVALAETPSEAPRAASKPRPRVKATIETTAGAQR